MSVRASIVHGKSRTQRLRASMLQQRQDGSVQRSPLREIILSSEMASHLMRFETTQGIDLTVRLELIDEPPGGDPGAYVVMDSVRLMTLPPGKASATGRPLPAPE